MNFAVIVCTFNRANDLERLLNSLSIQTLLPRQLIIVDASHDFTKAKSLTIEFRQKTGVDVMHIESPKGLTLQRNIGINNLLPCIDIVSFFDDDIQLVDNYLEYIGQIFEKDQEKKIGGIGGKIININEKKTNYSIVTSFFLKSIGLLGRIFLINSSKIQSVLISGMNVSNQQRALDNIKVNWLHGCTSYRRKVFDFYKFDENLKNYSMREDLDFSFRVSKKFILIFTPFVELIHHHSNTARASYREYGSMDIESWHWFVDKNMHGNKNKIYFYWGVVGYLLNLVLSAIFFRDKKLFERFKGGINALLLIVGVKSI